MKCSLQKANKGSAFWRGVVAGLTAPLLVLGPSQASNGQSSRYLEPASKQAWRNVGGYLWHSVDFERRKNGL